MWWGQGQENEQGLFGQFSVHLVHLKDQQSFDDLVPGPLETADHIISYLQQQGTVFEQLNIDPAIAKLVADLHDGTWFVLEQNSGKFIKQTPGIPSGV